MSQTIEAVKQVLQKALPDWQIYGGPCLNINNGQTHIEIHRYHNVIHADHYVIEKPTTIHPSDTYILLHKKEFDLPDPNSLNSIVRQIIKWHTDKLDGYLVTLLAIKYNLQRRLLDWDIKEGDIGLLNTNGEGEQTHLDITKDHSHIVLTNKNRVHIDYFNRTESSPNSRVYQYTMLEEQSYNLADPELSVEIARQIIEWHKQEPTVI